MTSTNKQVSGPLQAYHGDQRGEVFGFVTIQKHD